MAKRERNKLQQVSDQTEVRVLGVLREAAKAAAPCPTNTNMADRLGITEPMVSNAVSRLRKRGKIFSAYTGAKRRITVKVDATGAEYTTDWTNPADTPKKPSKIYSKPAQDSRLRQLKAVRDCLSCGKSFNSAHPGNRRCPRCKQSGDWLDGADTHESYRVAL